MKRSRRHPAAKRHSPLRTITVRRAPSGCHHGLVIVGGKTFRCALGKNGITAQKREGDGATPRAFMQMISGFCKPALQPIGKTALPMRRMQKKDGWCDTVGNANYNRAIRLPFSQSHETMLREDQLYDIGFILDWNFSHRKQRCGSAIFLHLAKPGYQPTQGCIALSRRDMERLMPYFSTRTRWIVI